MTNFNLKTIFTSDDKYTVLQLLKALINEVDSQEFVAPEDLDDYVKKEELIDKSLYNHYMTVTFTPQGHSETYTIGFNLISYKSIQYTLNEIESLDLHFAIVGGNYSESGTSGNIIGGSIQINGSKRYNFTCLTNGEEFKGYIDVPVEVHSFTDTLTLISA